MELAGIEDRKLPNIVLLVLDTARARNISCYGHERRTTPTIDKLAAKGVRFSRATSVAPWTLPSHASMFTGEPPSTHRTNSLDSHLPDSLRTLPQMLSNQGYDTVGLSANPWLSSQFGVTRGFDEFHHLFGPFATESYREFTHKLTNTRESVINRIRALLSSQSLDEIARNGMTAAYRQLTDREDDGAMKSVEYASEIIGQSNPYFLFINFLEPHLPFNPPSDVRRKFIPDKITDKKLASLNQDATSYNIRNVEMDSTEFELLERLYDAEIHHVDRQINQILELLDQTGQREETVVILLGDHGENIGDHKLMAHHYSVHETLTHIPLIIHYPDLFAGGDVVNDRVSSLDVPATLVDLLEKHDIVDETLQSQQYGIPLHDLSRGDRKIVAEYLNPMPPIERVREKSENPHFDISKYDRQLRAIYEDNYKFVRGSDGHRALYDLSTDDPENQNLLNRYPDKTSKLETDLDRWNERNDYERATDSATADEQLMNRLSDLGYL